MIIIGSTAMNYWFDDFDRQPNDLDYVVAQAATKVVRTENLITEYHTDPGLQWLLLQNLPHGYATPDMLYTIKISHVYWDVNWNKTIHDIMFLQSKNCKIIEEFYQILYSNWEIKHGNKNHITLQTTNQEFFNQYVDRKYDHDWIHEVMAYYDEPMHRKLKKNANMAMISKEMFFNLSYEDQLKTCREEIQVIALERELIPRNFKIPTQAAYVNALKALITHMTKGWFARFMAEHLSDLYKPDRKFIQIFKQAISADV